MEKDYVLDHDWGSYDSDETINKLMLRNTEDFMKYFDNEMKKPRYVAEKIGDYKFKFKDGLILEFIPSILE